MDINMIVEFIFKIFLIVFMTIILPKIKRHLDNEIGEEESEKLINLIYELVRAFDRLGCYIGDNRADIGGRGTEVHKVCAL